MIKNIARLAILMIVAACGPKPTASTTQPAGTQLASPPADGPEQVCNRQDVIYYGFNKATFNSEADAVLQTSAKQIAECASTRIRLVGHNDTAEPEPDVLSKARTDLVAQRLKALGVTAAIESRSAGSSELAIETGPGAKEPQNRRVTVEY